jgi:hypothetical protein
MTRVLIKDFLKPPKERSASTRPQGRRVRLFMLKNWSDVDQFTVMFEKGLRATISFMDEAFAKLLEGYSLDEFAEKVKFGRLSEYNEQLLVKAVSNRLAHRGGSVGRNEHKAKE